MNIITRIFLKGRQEDQGLRRWDLRSGDRCDLRKEPQTEKCKQLLESGKYKEAESSLGPPEGMQPCRHLDFRT